MPIHPTAIVSAAAVIDETATIGPYVTIEGPVRIGPGTRFAPFSCALGETEIGANVQVHSHAVIGDTPQDRRYHDESTRCIVGDHCVIREGATIHRATGAGNVTRVGDRCYLMTNTHIGHNCLVGNDVTLVSGALLGGHVTVGDNAIISGNTGVHQFVRIGNLAMVACVAPVTQDILPYMMTDHQGRIVGVNSIGLRRAGYTSSERAQIKRLFRLIYRNTLGRPEIIARIKDDEPSRVRDVLLAFVEAGTDRGLVRGRSGACVIDSPL
ncbi:MAG: acyl-ACP--UDP-N-acetylglucosamine O-acyltransferase [Planctomycetaceae bacterium]